MPSFLFTFEENLAAIVQKPNGTLAQLWGNGDGIPNNIRGRAVITHTLCA